MMAKTKWIFGGQHTPQPVVESKPPPDPVPSSADTKRFGLENFGNTCYANSVLQALYFCSPFRELILHEGDPSYPKVPSYPKITSIPPPLTPAGEIPKSQPTSSLVPVRRKPERKLSTSGNPFDPPQNSLPPPHPIPPSPPTLFSALRSLYLYISTHPADKGVVSPKAFIDKLKESKEEFRSLAHQDAHEFLNHLLNMVMEEIEEERKAAQNRDASVTMNGHMNGQTNPPSDDLSSSLATLSSKAAPTIATATSSNSGIFPQDATLVHKLFEGVLTSETRCLTCETVSSRDESFLDLSIDIEQNSSVTACLRQFSASEMLCQKNKFFCDACCNLQEAEKRMKIKRLPNVLALHLKRFKYQEDVQKYIKLTYRVAFPFELRLFNTVDSLENADRLYNLFAIVVHLGNGPYHGHYISIVKSNGSWSVFDDDNVYSIPESDIPKYFGDSTSGAAYVLYYQAVDIDLLALGLEPPESGSKTKSRAEEKVKILEEEDAKIGVNMGLEVKQQMATDQNGQILLETGSSIPPPPGLNIITDFNSSKNVQTPALSSLPLSPSTPTASQSKHLSRPPPSSFSSNTRSHPVLMMDSVPHSPNQPQTSTQQQLDAAVIPSSSHESSVVAAAPADPNLTVASASASEPGPATLAVSGSGTRASTTNRPTTLSTSKGIFSPIATTIRRTASSRPSTATPALHSPGFPPSSASTSTPVDADGNIVSKTGSTEQEDQGQKENEREKVQKSKWSASSPALASPGGESEAVPPVPPMPLLNGKVVNSKDRESDKDKDEGRRENKGWFKRRSFRLAERSSKNEKEREEVQSSPMTKDGGDGHDVSAISNMNVTPHAKRKDQRPSSSSGWFRNAQSHVSALKRMGSHVAVAGEESKNGSGINVAENKAHHGRKSSRDYSDIRSAATGDGRERESSTVTHGRKIEPARVTSSLSPNRLNATSIGPMTRATGSRGVSSETIDIAPDAGPRSGLGSASELSANTGSDIGPPPPVPPKSLSRHRERYPETEKKQSQSEKNAVDFPSPRKPPSAYGGQSHSRTSSMNRHSSNLSHSHTHGPGYNQLTTQMPNTHPTTKKSAEVHSPQSIARGNGYPTKAHRPATVAGSLPNGTGMRELPPVPGPIPASARRPQSQAGSEGYQKLEGEIPTTNGHGYEHSRHNDIQGTRAGAPSANGSMTELHSRISASTSMSEHAPGLGQPLRRNVAPPTSPGAAMETGHGNFSSNWKKATRKLSLTAPLLGLGRKEKEKEKLSSRP